MNFYTSYLRSSWQVGGTVSIAVALSGSGVYNTLSANGSLSVSSGGSLFASAVNDSCMCASPFRVLNSEAEGWLLTVDGVLV